MNIRSTKRFAGLAATWFAVYALVLNVMLSSALLAATPPAAYLAGHEICANSPDGSAGFDESGKSTGKAALHCPLCVGSHAPGVPPTNAVFVVSRIAVATTPELAPDSGFVERLAGHDHRARAPPRLS